MTALIMAVLQWHRTRGGPRKSERDAEIALQIAVDKWLANK